MKGSHSIDDPTGAKALLVKDRRIRFFLLLGFIGAIGCVFLVTARSNRQWKETLVENRKHALVNAAWNGDLPTVRALVEAGADVNGVPGHYHSDWTPLAQAIRHGNEDVVRYLLEHGAKFNRKSREMDPPLLQVCWNTSMPYHSKLSIAKLLLEHGADPNVTEKYGSTPLSAARKTHSEELVELLKKYGAVD